MSTFAIGDIHGYRGALDALLEAVPFGEGDRLVFLGDYVNKGPDAKGVIDRLLEIRERHKAVFLRGNHDEMMIDARRSAAGLRRLAALGGKYWLKSYGRGSLRKILSKVPDEHWDFLRRVCQDYFETKKAIYVHGGLRPLLDPADEDPDRLQSMKIDAAAPHFSGKLVICGHSAQADGRLVDLGHTICLDSGIAKGASLTCLNTKSFRYWQVTQGGRLKAGTLRKNG